MKKAGVIVSPGSFGENIIVKDFMMGKLRIGDRFKIGLSAVLEITQFGKECHAPCAIFKQVGFCIMPQEGVFARVIASGVVKTLDPVDLIKPF
jgi:MOSC domain-containing protein YiiM